MSAEARDRIGLVVLVVSAAVLAVVGLMGLLVPDVLHESNGIAPVDDPGLLSEVRGAGAELLAVGGLVLVGARVPVRRRAAAVVTAAVLLAYAGGRGVAWVADGAPASGLVVAGAVELVLGLVLVAHLATTRLGADAADRVSSPAR